MVKFIGTIVHFCMKSFVSVRCDFIFFFFFNDFFLMKLLISEIYKINANTDVYVTIHCCCSYLTNLLLQVFLEQMH